MFVHSRALRIQYINHLLTSIPFNEDWLAMPNPKRKSEAGSSAILPQAVASGPAMISAQTVVPAPASTSAQAQASVQAPTSTSNSLSLMSLPPEVRDRIYRLALPRMIGGPPHLNLSLLLVSKKVHSEIFHIPYQGCIWFPTTNILGRFLNLIGHVHYQQVKNVSVQWWGHQSKWAFQLLKKCKSLEKVTVYLDGRHRPPGYAALCEVSGSKEVNIIDTWHWAGNSAKGYWDRPLREQVEFKDEELLRAMKRPRCKRDEKDPAENLDCFAKKRRTSYRGSFGFI